MAKYLIHLTGDGDPVGVYVPTGDYYLPGKEHLRDAAREIVYARLPSVKWSEFIQKLASLTPSPRVNWDVYEDSSKTLPDVLRNAIRAMKGR